MTIYFQFSSIFKHRLTVGFLLTSIKLINLEWNLFLGTHFGKCWSLMGKADTDSEGKNLHSAKEKEALSENQRIRRWQGTSVLWRILYSVCDVILN